MRYFFASLDEKHNLLESLRKFSKVLTHILKKIAKMHHLGIFFTIDLTGNALIFCAFGRKTEFIGKFEKTFKNFENLLMKTAKNASF